MKLAPLSLILLLGGCATTPVSLASLRQDPCVKGFVFLYFKAEAETLRSPVGSGLDWPAQAIDQCPTVRLKVRGLPSPSSDSLQGRRARTVSEALRVFGLPEPAFELGDAEDQASPVVEIDARP